MYVGDRGLEALVVYDRFGTYVRLLADGLARDVQAVSVRKDRVVVVLPRRLLVYDDGGLLLKVYDVSVGEPLRDVAVADGAFFLLTERRVVRAAP